MKLIPSKPADQWKPVIFAGAFGLIVLSSVLSSLHPMRGLLVSVWVAGAGLMLLYIGRRFDRVYKRDWFDPRREADAPKEQWCEVENVIDVEPLNYERSLWYPKWTSVRDFVAVLILAVFFAFAFRLIVSVELNGLEPADIANWALPAAVLALIGTVLTVFYQVRLTARTQNRAEWIGTIRRKMAAVISLRDVGREPDEAQLLEIDKRITELELLLNPGERLHRTFLTLIRDLHGIDDSEFDKKPRLELGGTFAIEEIGDTEEAFVKKRKARCIRVCNAILKYEWERVKHAE